MTTSASGGAFGPRVSYPDGILIAWDDDRPDHAEPAANRRPGAVLPHSQPRPQSAVPPPSQHQAPAITPLAELVARRNSLDRAIDAEIDRLVRAAVGWPAIARALGVTRQAVRQRQHRRRAATSP